MALQATFAAMAASGEGNTSGGGNTSHDPERLVAALETLREAHGRGVFGLEYPVRAQNDAGEFFVLLMEAVRLG